MRNRSPFFLLVFCTYILNAQAQWTEFPPHNAEDVELIYVSDEGHLVGLLKYPTRLMKSDDLGENWSVFDEISGPYHPSDGKRFNRVKQDKDGNYWHSPQSSSLRKFDNSQNKWNHQFHAGGSIFDYQFLDNGNILVATSNKRLQLYSSQGILIRQHILSYNIYQILLGEGDTHYAVQGGGTSRFIFKFNSDLSIIEEEWQHRAPSSERFIISDNRIIGYASYSDDGINWVPFPNGLEGIVAHLNNNTIAVANRDGVYISINNATTFSNTGSMPLGSPSIYGDGIFAIGDQDLIICESGFCNKSIYYSINDLSDWKTVKPDIGNPYSYDIELAGSHILLNSCGNFDLRFNQQMNAWEDYDLFQNNDPWCLSYYVESLSDGTLISDNGSYSNDGGKTWEKNFPFNATQNGMIVNNDIVYIINYETIYKSIDSGLSWTPYSQTYLPDTIRSIHPHGISASGEVYHEVGMTGYYRTTLEGEVLSEIGLGMGGFTIDVLTSYYGDDIYYLHANDNREVYLFHSSDDGNNFKSKKIEDTYSSSVSYSIDHLGNLYKVNDNEIKISQDHGGTWQDITPMWPSDFIITGVEVGFDNHIYLATKGAPIFKSDFSITTPDQLCTQVYLDDDNNCEWNDESFLANIKININDEICQITDENGETQANLLSGTYRVEAELRPDLYRSCDPIQDVVLERGDPKKQLFFPVEIIEHCNDVGVTGTLPLLRRCFENKYYIELYNDGSTIAQNVKLKLTLDEHFEFVSADMNVISSSGLEYIFEIEDLRPNQKHRHYVNFVLSCNSELGEQHYMNTEVLYDNACPMQLRDDSAFLCLENRGSYDPNDKIIFLNGIAGDSIIESDDDIEYLIRFQNTGTDTAITVRIEDKLSNNFYVRSAYPVAASHDFNWTLEQNRLIVEFDNILLPDSTINEPASHGFVKFEIKVDSSMTAPGSIIENSADIYFDFNEPIKTNTVESFYLCKDTSSIVNISICPDEVYDGYQQTGVYVDTLSTKSGCDSVRTLNLDVVFALDCITSTLDAINDELSIYPNPAKNNLYVQYSGNQRLKSYVIYNTQGHLSESIFLNKNSIIGTQELSSGIYFLKLIFNDGSFVTKKIVIAR